VSISPPGAEKHHEAQILGRAMSNLLEWLIMKLGLQAEVRHGRLILDEPVDLPEGTKIELIPADDRDELDEAERERLHAALRRSAEQFARGEGIAAVDALRRLDEP
jgi:hypothetical protein